MIHTKKIKIPATEKEVEDYKTCDICNKKIKDSDGYTSNEVEIRYERSSGTPDGGETKTTEIDMCVNCFENKLIPWLKSYGAAPRIRESEW